MAINGTIELKGHVDGQATMMKFNDMPISMPIASMRQTIKRGNDLHITPHGGVIRNRVSGKTIKLHERGGVYFFKMKLLPPHLQVDTGNAAPPKNRSTGFARPA